jgi:hypothetical protein
MEITKDLLTAIAKLKTKERTKVMTHLGKIEYTKCAEDVMYWLDSSRHYLPYVYTMDPHELYSCSLCNSTTSYPAKQREVHLEVSHEIFNIHEKEYKNLFTKLDPVRPFPIKEYMPPLIKYMLTEPLMAIEKSRDVMATWLVVAVCTWDAFFHRGRQIIFQSKTSSDSNELIKRANHIYKNQPKFLKSVIKGEYNVGQNRSGELKFPTIDSEILGLPQGPDIIRQLHPSVVFTDETAYHPQAHDTFTALKPTIQHGGSYIGISSANPGWFQAICQDTLEPN